MQSFHYKKDILCVEDITLEQIANQIGTPCYVYSRATLQDNWHQFQQALTHQKHKICYAVKANSNLAILQLFANLGSGFDIVSGGELQRVLAAGGDANNIVFSGVGKTPSEISDALTAGIYCFNVESADELYAIQDIAKSLDKMAKISLRVNPDIDAGTHPYIATGMKENKFGIETKDIVSIAQFSQRASHITLAGLACHIGSQITELTPFLAAIDRILILVQALKETGITLSHLNIGGGLGIHYENETPPSISDYVSAILKKIHQPDLEIIFEPGRVLVGNAGLLLTRVQYIKQTTHKHFAIVDAAMNDLIRPALYAAWQPIIPVNKHSDAQTHSYDIVGPVCESGDFLGKQRELNLQQNDLLAILCVGAYGSSMSSEYNTRPKIAEVMIDKAMIHVIREREPVTDIFKYEKRLPNL